VRRLGQSLEQWARIAGLGRLDLDGMIREHWTQLVGPRLARLTAPVRVRDGRLVVSASVPAAAEQIRWSAADLIRAIGEVSGDADAVRVVDVRVEGTPPGPGS